MQTPKTRFKIYINWFLCVFFLNNFNRLKFQSVQYLLYSFQLSVVQLKLQDDKVTVSYFMQSLQQTAWAYASTKVAPTEILHHKWNSLQM